MYRRLKLTIGIVAALAAGTTVAGSVESSWQRNLPVGALRYVSIENLSGDIEIVPATNDQIEISAVRKVTGANESRCAELVEQLVIETRKSSGQLTISSTPLRDRSYESAIDYTISIPATVSVRVATERGNVAVSDREGEVAVRTGEGDIEVSNCNNELDAKSRFGNIIVESTTTNATLETERGNIDLYLPQFDRGRIRVKSNEGSVQLHLPDGISANVSARTNNGRVMNGPFSGTLLTNGTGTYTSGRFGYGDGSLIVETGSGTILFDRYRTEPVAQASPPSSTPTAATSSTVVVHEYRTVVRDCYPRFHHFRHYRYRPPSIIVGFPPVHIEVGRPRARHDDWFWNWEHRDRDRDHGRRDDHGRGRDCDRRDRDDRNRHWWERR